MCKEAETNEEEIDPGHNLTQNWLKCTFRCVVNNRSRFMDLIFIEYNSVFNNCHDIFERS